MSPGRPSRWSSAVAALALLLASPVVTACADGDDSAKANRTTTTAAASGSSAPAGGFPVEVEHDYGTTTVEAAPERVVALGYGEGDLAAALGFTPVGVNAYGSTDGEPTPWLAEALGGAEVELLDTGTAIPFERIDELDPDLILAATLGMEANAYDLLARIAPTVVTGPDGLDLSWQDAIVEGGRILGRADEAAKLVEDAEAELVAVREAHPDLEGATYAVALVNPGSVNVVVNPEDPTADVLGALGLEMGEEVRSMEPNVPGGSGATLSYELLDRLDVDVLLVAPATGASLQDFLDQPLVRNLDVAERGGIISVPGDLWTAMRVPTVLSVP